MSRKSDRVLKARNDFVKRYGIESLRALATIRQRETGRNVNVNVTDRSLATYKANLNRGVYTPFVGPNFRNDKMNLVTCSR